jgi:hypothetical protein
MGSTQKRQHPGTKLYRGVDTKPDWKFRAIAQAATR